MKFPWPIPVAMLSLSTVATPLVSLGLEPADVDQQTYCNPVRSDVADPYILRVDGTYYLYSTDAPFRGFGVATSSDLVNWTDHPPVFTRSRETWAREHFWAPCVVPYDGYYYLFYSAVGPTGSGRTSHRICVARSISPLGPFEDVRAPLLDIGQAVIDAEVFIDDDTQAWLFFSLDCSENGISEICVVPLSKDLLSIAGEVVRCVKPSQPWEGPTWNEAPCVFKVGPTYMMMYSGRGFFDPRYSVGYATAPSPAGPWTKKGDNPILHRTDDVLGPGHNCVIASPDDSELFVAYHTHQTEVGPLRRQLAIDRLHVEVDAVTNEVTLRVAGPTHTPQPMPAGAEPNLAFDSVANPASVSAK